MSRPTKERIVNTPPIFNSYKPTGFNRSKLKRILIRLDEYEAIRLADYQGLDHATAAERMKISRSTFTRLIESARKKVASFIIEGGELVIDGGNIHFRGNIFRCLDCEHIFRADFSERINKCPSCKSEKILDIAGGFGHGRGCCGRHRGGRGR